MTCVLFQSFIFEICRKVFQKLKYCSFQITEDGLGVIFLTVPFFKEHNALHSIRTHNGFFNIFSSITKDEKTKKRKFIKNTVEKSIFIFCESCAFIRETRKKKCDGLYYYLEFCAFVRWDYWKRIFTKSFEIWKLSYSIARQLLLIVKLYDTIMLRFIW